MSGIWNRWLVVAGVLALGWNLGTAQNFYIQPKTNSPYSRFGLGDPADPYFAAAAGMAGVGASFNDPSHFNAVNPASLGWLQVTAFEVGLYTRYSGLRTGGESSSNWSGNLNYFSLAIPLKNPINQALERQKNKFGWGTAVALQPYTNVGYYVESVSELPGAGQTVTSLKGTGGTYKLGWSNGLRFGQLSLGVEAGYLFGKATYSRRVEFDSLDVSYATELLDETSLKSLQWKTGVQYTLDLGKKTPAKWVNDIGKPVLTAGAYFSNAPELTSTTSRLYYRDNFDLSAPIDTFASATGAEASGTLPGEMGFGLTFEKKDKLRISAEYAAGKWSNYRNEARPESLLDSWRFAFGGELIPDVTSYNNYFQRVRYRAGFYYGTDPRSVNGAQIKEYGITLGAGFPIILPRQTTSFLNIALEAGRFGLEESLMENFVQMTLGFTLNDNSWFFKRKFN
ncbi:MAG: hypothetical protein IPN74_13820 [Haliscomenobacter sp.]|nr:hypothetical protein [Haliscomenobacter sp.]